MSQRSTGSLKRAICVENRSQMEDGAGMVPWNPCHSSWDHRSCLPMCLSSHFSTGFFCPLKCAVWPLKAFAASSLCLPLFFPVSSHLCLTTSSSSLILTRGEGWIPWPSLAGWDPWMYLWPPLSRLGIGCDTEAQDFKTAALLSKPLLFE